MKLLIFYANLYAKTLFHNVLVTWKRHFFLTAMQCF